MELLVKTIETLGTLLIAWAALRVHHRVLNEHHISKKVFRTMKREQRMGVLGMALILLGYLIEITILA